MNDSAEMYSLGVVGGHQWTRDIYTWGGVHSCASRHMKLFFSDLRREFEGNSKGIPFGQVQPRQFMAQQRMA